VRNISWFQLASWDVVVARVRELLRVAGFDPEVIETICEVYTKARKPVCDTNKPDPVNELIALRILSLAKRGERDPDQLRAEALAALPNKSAFDP
jgi:hypothetical protein